MSVGLAWPVFAIGALVSLATSWVLVSRLERVGERIGLSEGLLGLLAALAADAPEVTSAVTALSHHQRTLGAGVVIGSNVFNLAGLLGLGGLVAGRIALHRKVVVLGGSVAVWIAGLCLGIALGWIPPALAVALALVAVGLYVVVLSGGARSLQHVGLPSRWSMWLVSAVSEEEQELGTGIRPSRGQPKDVVVASVALVVVVTASVAMERSASTLGARYRVAEIVVGGLVLAAVTSLPNAVAAVYLAARGRGAATFSTALNSNTLNVAVGLLIPSLIIGLGTRSGQTTLIAGWYVGLTVVVLGFAYLDHGVSRAVGMVIIFAYLAFVASVLLSARSLDVRVVILPAVAAAIAFVFWLTQRRRRRVGVVEPAPPPSSRPVTELPLLSLALSANGSGPESHASDQVGLLVRRHPEGRESLVARWPVHRVWQMSLIVSIVIGVVDAALGQRVVLIGLLIATPCGALLTGRWIRTALAGVWAIGLALILGVPDGIWGTHTQLAFVAAVAIAGIATTAAAAVIQAHRFGPPRQGGP